MSWKVDASLCFTITNKARKTTSGMANLNVKTHWRAWRGSLRKKIAFWQHIRVAKILIPCVGWIESFFALAQLSPLSCFPYVLGARDTIRLLLLPCHISAAACLVQTLCGEGASALAVAEKVHHLTCANRNSKIYMK